MEITLREITKDNWEECIKLKVGLGKKTSSPQISTPLPSPNLSQIGCHSPSIMTNHWLVS